MSVQADLFKAVLAAVYVDSGFTLRAPAEVYAVKLFHPIPEALEMCSLKHNRPTSL